MMERFKGMVMKRMQVFRTLICSCFLAGFAAVPAYASEPASGGTITDMLDIFSQLFGWILDEGATLLEWMLDKPILMIAMGLFFCGAIIAFLMRIYHSV